MFDHSLKLLLQTKLGEMGLVTREEFDIQTQVLAKTREKLENLEKLLREIEQKLPDSV